MSDVGVDERLSDIEVLLTALVRGGDRLNARWLTVEGAAAYCSLSTASIRRMIDSGELTAHRPGSGGRVLIDKRQLDSAIQNATARPRKGRGIRRKPK